MVPYEILIGGGIRREFADQYRDAQERGAIVTGAAPDEAGAGLRRGPRGLRGRRTRRCSTRSCADLFARGLSPRIVKRDLARANDFALGYLLSQPAPRSLRDFRPADVAKYLAAEAAGGRQAKGGRAAALTSIKRLLRFLRDTGRMDYNDAKDVLRRALK